MEWDPPSADGVKVLDIVPTYVGTHRLTGDVHTGGMRAQPLSYTLCLERLRQRLSLVIIC